MEGYTLNILIVEDDVSFQLELEMLIESIGYEVVAIVDNAFDALEVVLTKQVDFILMDIELKGNMTGIQLAERIKDKNIPILFISSFGDNKHYQAAQQSLAVGYLVKPLNKLSLRTTINLALQNLQRSINKKTKVADGLTEEFVLNDYLFFKKKKKFSKIAIEDILMVKSEREYIDVCTKDKQIFNVRFSIGKMEELLPSHKFLRCHRSYIIQLEKMEAIDFVDWVIKIEDYSIPVSKKNRSIINKMVKRLE